MSNYVYFGVDRDGVERGGMIAGQATPSIWAETFYKRRWRSVTITYEGVEVGAVCINAGIRTWWGESTPRREAQ